MWFLNYWALFAIVLIGLGVIAVFLVADRKDDPPHECKEPKRR